MRERILLRIDKVEMHNLHEHIAQQIPAEYWRCMYASVYAQYTSFMHILCITEVCLNSLRAIVCQRSCAAWCARLRHATKGNDNIGVAHALL